MVEALGKINRKKICKKTAIIYLQIIFFNILFLLLDYFI